MKALLCVTLCFIAALLMAEMVPLETAQQVAVSRIAYLYPNHRIASQETICNVGNPLAYVFKLLPTGYIVVSAQYELPPVLAYSGTSQFEGFDGGNVLQEMITADLGNRLQANTMAVENREAWERAFMPTRFQQWPPAGYSTTEGWIKTLWTQNAPYNWMCPDDPVTNTASYAGCPAVAMGQIVNFHQALNETRFDDTDDYYHNYNGRSYWIDNDFAAHNFPSFPQLNGYLDELNTSFRYNQNLSDSLKAALIFACGTALKQVYASNGSGTFGVNQAFAAFTRFGFSEAELLTDTAPDLYTRMSNNVKAAYPVHLAVVTPAWDMGHNVVVDGYNTDNYYHLNFGWGGSYNGWYLLPSEIPYGLTVVEGAVVDIIPRQYVMTVPDSLFFDDTEVQTLEVVNLTGEPVVLQEIVPEAAMQNMEWNIVPSMPLPATIPAYGILSVSINLMLPVRDYVQTGFRLILDNGFADVPLSYNTASEVDDAYLPAAISAVSAYPNPFVGMCSLSFKAQTPWSLEIYNIKGQKVFSGKGQGSHEAQSVTWNGLGTDGKSCASGVYMYKLTGQGTSSSGRILKLK